MKNWITNLSIGPSETISSVKPNKNIQVVDKKNTKTKFRFINWLNKIKVIISERKKLIYIAIPPILTLPFGMDLQMVFLSINFFCEPNLTVHGKNIPVKINDIIEKKRINIIKTLEIPNIYYFIISY